MQQCCCLVPQLETNTRGTATVWQQQVQPFPWSVSLRRSWQRGSSSRCKPRLRRISGLHGRSRTTYIWATMLGPAVRFFVAYLATVVTGTSKATGSRARAWATRSVNVMISLLKRRASACLRRSEFHWDMRRLIRVLRRRRLAIRVTARVPCTM